MNRTERLYAVVEELRARAPRTMRAIELAERFEVSIRTIERDLLALQEAGVPIWAQPGPGGGYGLNVETTLPPLNLTAAEAVAIASALAATRSMPFAGAGRSALQKVTSALSATNRATAEQIASQVRVVAEPTDPHSPVRENIEQALRDRVAIGIEYGDAEENITRRVIEPAGYFSSRGQWYLCAWCRLRQAPRAFRMDRIGDAWLTNEQIVPRSLDDILAELPYDLVPPPLV